MDFREATSADIDAIAALLADDDLGKTREQAGNHQAYEAAFHAIGADQNNILIVGEVDGQVAACAQLTIIPSLTFQGATRGQIEGVRVASQQRGAGAGRDLIQHAIALATSKDCRIIQLTTNKARPDAIRFYKGLGFEDTHEGMKLYL